MTIRPRLLTLTGSLLPGKCCAQEELALQATALNFEIVY